MLTGLDVDLAKATFACLGVKTQSRIEKCSGLLPSVITGRADLMWNNLY